MRQRADERRADHQEQSDGLCDAEGLRRVWHVSAVSFQSRRRCADTKRTHQKRHARRRDASSLP